MIRYEIKQQSKVKGQEDVYFAIATTDLLYDAHRILRERKDWKYNERFFRQ